MGKRGTRKLPEGSFPSGYGQAARLEGGHTFDEDGAVNKGEKDVLTEAGGRTGRVRELDKKDPEEKQELTPDQEFEAMWRVVDNAAYTGGYDIRSSKEQIKEELRRIQAEGLKSADFGVREAMSLIGELVKPESPKQKPEPVPVKNFEEAIMIVEEITLTKLYADRKEELVEGGAVFEKVERNLEVIKANEEALDIFEEHMGEILDFLKKHFEALRKDVEIIAGESLDDTYARAYLQEVFEEMDLQPGMELSVLANHIDVGFTVAGRRALMSFLKEGGVTDEINSELSAFYLKYRKKTGERVGLIKNPPEEPITEKSVFGHEPSDEARDRFWQRARELNDAGDYEILASEDGLRKIAREVEREIEGEKIAYEQFRGFYERVVDDSEKDSEIVNEGARLLVEWLMKGNDVNDITTELLTGMAMDAQAQVQYREYENSLRSVENLILDSIIDNINIEEKQELQDRLENLQRYPDIVKQLNKLFNELRNFLEENRESLKGAEEEPEEGDEDLVDFYIRRYTGYIILNNQAGMNYANATREKVVSFLNNTLLRANNVAENYFKGNVGFKEFREGNKIDIIE